MENMKINNTFGDIREKIKIFIDSIKIACKEEKGISNIFKRIDEEYDIRETKYMLRQIQLEYLEEQGYEFNDYNQEDFEDEDFYEDYKKDVEWSKKHETIENMKRDVILTVESLKLNNFKNLDEKLKNIKVLDDYNKLTDNEIKKYYFDVALPYYYEV